MFVKVDADFVWMKLDSFASSNFPMGARSELLVDICSNCRIITVCICYFTFCSCNFSYNASALQAAEELGLCINHCYSLVTTASVNLGGGTMERLVQLRNPWGSKCWRGRWCNRDKVWSNTGLRQQVNYTTAARNSKIVTVCDDVQVYHDVLC